MAIKYFFNRENLAELIESIVPDGQNPLYFANLLGLNFNQLIYMLENSGDSEESVNDFALAIQRKLNAEKTIETGKSYCFEIIQNMNYIVSLIERIEERFNNELFGYLLGRFPSVALLINEITGKPLLFENCLQKAFETNEEIIIGDPKKITVEFIDNNIVFTATSNYLDFLDHPTPEIVIGFCMGQFDNDIAFFKTVKEHRNKFEAQGDVWIDKKLYLKLLNTILAYGE